MNAIVFADAQSPQLSWYTDDPEQRMAFRGGRFTRVNSSCSFLIGAVLTAAFYGVMFLLHESYFSQMFCQRGIVPYFIVFFFFWALAIVILKTLKLRLQQRALHVLVVPDSTEFVLSPSSVEEVTHKIYDSCDDPKKFVLFNRICIALANLKNIGRVSDVDEILHTQAENDESGMETSYSLVSAFVWAIPVLGFIGTVLGLSGAIGGFGSVLSASNDMTQVKEALQDVAGGLSVAFETTLQGLVAALIVQLMLTSTKKSEEEFLDACSEYCVRNVVGRLRVTPYEMGGED